MLEYLFIVCQLWSDPPVMKRVEVVRSITVCSRGDNIACSDGYLVVFSDEVSARPVRDTSCLYITKDNIKEIEYEN
jgi:hypothetical protein